MTDIPLFKDPCEANQLQDRLNQLVNAINSKLSSGGGYNPGAVTITGGTINGTAIGSVTPSTGSFTALNATSGFINGDGIVTLTAAQSVSNKAFTTSSWTGGTIAGAIINSSTVGLTTPAAAKFTTATLTTSLIFPDSTVQTTAAVNNADVNLRHVRIACVATSIYGTNYSQWTNFVTRYGAFVFGTLNGGNAGQQAEDCANHFHTNVVSQDPAICMLAIASNDFLGGLPTDAPVPGRGSIANAKFYLVRIIEQARAAGIRVAITTEPYRNPPQTGVNSNPIYWNSTYLPALVASYNDPNIILIDTAGVLANTTTGVSLTPIPQTNGTGTNGASSFVVASATGITLGMYCYANSGALTTPTTGCRVIGISGTTITFSGTISGTLNETIYFYSTFIDNVHPSPIGASAQADLIYTSMNAAGWLPTYHSPKPLTSDASAAGIDNLIANGTLEGGSSAGVGTGWTNTFTSPSITTNANFIGSVQQVTLAPGDASGKLLFTPSANVITYRGRWIYVSCKVAFANFAANGAICDVRGTFDQAAPALPSQFTAAFNQPVYYSNVSWADGVYTFTSRFKVPQNASSFGFLITNTLPFPSGAASTGTIQVGEVACFDNDNPLEDRTPTSPATVIGSGSVSAYVISPYDSYLGMDATAGSVSKALPAATAWTGRKITVKKTDASVNTITITGAVDGSSVLSAQYQFATFTSDGTNINLIGASSGGSPGGSTTQFQYNNAGAFAGAAGLTYNSGTTSVTLTSAAAAALSVGPNGATTPVLSVNASTASTVAGIQFIGGAAGAGMTMQVTSSAGQADESGTWAAKGAGNLTLNATNGGVNLQGQVTMTNGGTVCFIAGYQTKFTNNNRGANLPGFLYNAAGSGGIVPSTDINTIQFNTSVTQNYQTGAKATQTDFFIGVPTLTANAASAVTQSRNVYISGAPIASTNITQTASMAHFVDGNNVGAGTTNSYTEYLVAQSGATNNYIASWNGSVGEVLRVRTDGQIFLLTTITASGTNGAQTINKPSGTVNFAAAATSLVVTNSLCTANSIIIATVRSNDTTMKSVQAVPAAGSFTLFANAAATAACSVGWLIIN